jgi:hypothetical protein
MIGRVCARPKTFIAHARAFATDLRRLDERCPSDHDGGCAVKLARRQAKSSVFVLFVALVLVHVMTRERDSKKRD